MKVLAIAVLLASSVSTVAFAQGRGTEQEQAACTRDVTRFCRPVMDQGDFVILACLKENRPKISKACDDVLKSHGQ